MIWAVPAILVLLILHKGLEGIVCSGGDGVRRKLLWNWWTATGFVLIWAALWAGAIASVDFRQQWGGWVFFGTPVVLGAAGIFAYTSWLAYLDERDGEDAGKGDAAN